MAHLKLYFNIRFIIVCVSGLLLSNCNGNLDFSGFIRSTDRVNTRFEQSSEWNKNHPYKTLVTNTENYQLLVAADSHIGGLNNFKILIEEAKKPENVAFVMVGDIVSGKKEDYLTLKNALPDFNQYPYFLIVGNHDLYFDGWKTFSQYFGTSTYYFSVQTPSAKDLYICLDTGGGTLGSKQLAWLKNLLKLQRQNYRNCFVFSHVNFFREHHTGSTNPLETELEVLLALFTDYQINMVISGHDHLQAVNRLGYTTYLTIDALLDNYYNASLLQLSIYEGKVGYKFIKIP